MLSDKAKSLKPYVAGFQPADFNKYIKLNTNENPYPPSPKAADALKRFDAGLLRRYPDPDSKRLVKAIAAAEGVDEDRVFVGNGSDEVLSLAINALYNPYGKPVLTPAVGYSFYPVFFDYYGIPYKSVRMLPGFKVDVNALKGGQGAVLANPNAPTSLALSPDEIEEVLQNNRGAVIVDEAYIAFADTAESAVPFLKKYENAVVVKTFSKSYSLAGIRCGYLIASPETVAGIKRIRDCFNSYPVDSVCEAVCGAAVSDKEYYSACVKRVSDVRNKTAASLEKIGFEVLSSDTNFLFATAGKLMGGKELYNKLFEKGVIVRRFDAPEIGEYLRITMGTEEEMERFITTVLEILG